MTSVSTSLGLLLLPCILPNIWLGVETKAIDRDLTISVQQKAILQKFRRKVLSSLPHEYMKEDLYLIRWLRARNFNIQDAREMLMNNLKWRKENRMDKIHQENWSDFNRDYPYYLDGRDKEGKPILFASIGNMDIRKAVVSGKRDRFIRYMEKIVDEGASLVRDMSEKHKNVTQGMVLINIKGYNVVEQGCLQCIPVILRGLILTYENYYPGVIDKLIFVNTPDVFEPFLTAIRGLLSPTTSKSLRIHGTNKREWKKALSRDFDWSELPPELGGTKIYQGMDDY